MDQSTLAVIALGILALVAVAFVAVFRGRGKIDMKGPGGVSLRAEGENPAPPSAVPSGVRIKDAEAGQNLRAQSTGPGGVDLEKVKAKGNIDAANSPGTLGPKQ
jgi:hypothetical protein